MKYGIVGNRYGWSYYLVKKKLQELGVTTEDVIISGGADGIDTMAENYAKSIGAEMIILFPNPNLPSPNRYFARNKEIAKRCDILIAFDKGSSSGSGTLNTINHAKNMRKKVILIESVET